MRLVGLNNLHRRLLLLAALIFLLSSPSLWAQDSRAEQWRKKRLEKAGKVQPDTLSALERRIRWAETRGLQLLNFHYKNLYPRFGSLSTGSGFAAGARYWLPNVERSFFDVQSSGVWSLRGYQFYDLQLGEVHVKERGFFAHADFSYRYFSQEDFFGVGPASKKEDRTNYRIEKVTYEGVGGYRFNRWATLGGRAGLVQIDLGDGSDARFPTTRRKFDESTAPGLNLQPDFFHAQTFLELDYSDSPGNPHSGGVAKLGLERYDDRNRRLFEFNRFVADARHYIPLGNRERVLALLFYTSMDNAPAGRRVPFYLQQTLGGSHTLRGFREFRFQDNNLLYLSAEYRWEPGAFWELVLFLDRGKVFADRGDFNFEHLEKSWGIGTRFKTRQGVVIRVDVGRSREGARVYLKFEPSF